MHVKTRFLKGPARLGPFSESCFPRLSQETKAKPPYNSNMRKFSFWSSAVSIYCSLSIFSSVCEVGQTTAQWAAAGNPQAVERQLSAMVSRLGGAPAAPAAFVEAQGKPLPLAPDAAPERLEPHANWVVSLGKPNAISADNARLFGVNPGQSIPIVQKSYKNNVQGITRAFDVSTTTAHQEIFIINRTDDRVIVWHASRAGKILGTTYLDVNTPIALVPNARYEDMFNADLLYWDAKVPPTPTQVVSGDANQEAAKRIPD